MPLLNEPLSNEHLDMGDTPVHDKQYLRLISITPVLAKSMTATAKPCHTQNNITEPHQHRFYKTSTPETQSLPSLLIAG